MKTRQVKIERKRSKRINRKAKQMIGRQTHVFQQGNNKGYDVEMIRDCLDQLLLEIRVQHHENLKCISELKKHENLKDLSEKLDKDVSPPSVP